MRSGDKTKGKVISVLVALTLLFSFASVASAGKPSAPPEIGFDVFVHYAAPMSQPIWDDTQDDYGFVRGGVRWPVLPIDFYVDDGVPSSVISAVTAGFDSAWENWSPWTTDPPANVFAYGGILPVSTLGPYRDNKNTVFWQPLSSGVLGATYIWSIPALKQVVEFDVVLNSNENWAAYDLWSVSAHEAGHGLSLNDLKPPKDQALTMYAYTWAGDIGKRTLGYGDYLGLVDLYNL